MGTTIPKGLITFARTTLVSADGRVYLSSDYADATIPVEVAVKKAGGDFEPVHCRHFDADGRGRINVGSDLAKEYVLVIVSPVAVAVGGFIDAIADHLGRTPRSGTPSFAVAPGTFARMGDDDGDDADDESTVENTEALNWVETEKRVALRAADDSDDSDDDDDTDETCDDDGGCGATAGVTVDDESAKVLVEAAPSPVGTVVETNSAGETIIEMSNGSRIAVDSVSISAMPGDDVEVSVSGSYMVTRGDSDESDDGDGGVSDIAGLSRRLSGPDTFDDSALGVLKTMYGYPPHAKRLVEAHNRIEAQSGRLPRVSVDSSLGNVVDDAVREAAERLAETIRTEATLASPKFPPGHFMSRCVRPPEGE